MTGPRTAANRDAANLEPRPAGDDAATTPATPTTSATPATPDGPGGHQLSPTARRRLMVIAVIAALVVLALGARYLVHTSNHVSTDNAQVDGNQIQISAPGTGTLVEWRAVEGTRLRKNEVVGRIRIGPGGTGPQQVVRAPEDGTVGLSRVVAGSYVTEGTPLATAYDVQGSYVTARVDETDIGDVRPGALVDISVDAYPDTRITGVVQQIQPGSAGVFSALPQANTTGNFQEVTQVIPVRIVLLDTGGVRLVPGMSVSVDIESG